MSLNQRNHKRLDFWKNQIKSWKESGLSQSEYSRQNNIDEQLFSKWKIRLSKNIESNFVQITAAIKKDFLNEPELELVIKENYSIKVHSGFNPETLKKLIKVIEG
jgi:hypothetical protein